MCVCLYVRLCECVCESLSVSVCECTSRACSDLKYERRPSLREKKRRFHCPDSFAFRVKSQPSFWPTLRCSEPRSRLR